jgi:hypothetical protein
MAIANKILPLFAVCLVPVIIVVLLFVYGDYNHKAPEHVVIGSGFQVKLGALSAPARPFVRRDPYSMHIPRPDVVYGNKETFWSSFLSLFRFSNTAIDQAVIPKEANNPECFLQHNGTFEYSNAELDTFRKRIKAGFRLNYYVDDMPVVSEYKDGLWYGVPIGFLSEDKQDVYLYTHYDIHISVDVYGRTLHASFVPRHTDPTAPCGEEYAQPTRAVSEVTWSYRTFVHTLKTKYEDRFKFYDQKLHGQHSKIEMVALIYSCLAAIGILVVLGLLSWNISRRKYDLEGFLLQTSATLAGEAIIEQPYASDSDSYEEIELDLQVPDGRVKARQRNKGKAERAQLIDVDVSYTGPNTQTYLKRAASVILGAPRRVVLLSALVGTGVHLLTVTLLGLALSSLVQQTLNNAWQTIIVIMMPTTGWVAGFASTRVLRLYRSKRVLCSGIIMTVILPSWLIFLFFFVNSIELASHDSAIQVALFFFCLFMVAVYFVSMMGGMWLASKFKVPTLPEYHTMRYLPENRSACQWITQFVLTTVVSSVAIGIGVVYVTMKIVQSFWANRVIMLVFVIFGFILLWVLITAALSVLVTYFNVVSPIGGRNPYWHWKTFITSGGPAVVAWLVGIFYAITLLQDVDLGSQTLIFIIITFSSVMMFISLGSVGVITVDTFFRRYVYRYLVIRE